MSDSGPWIWTGDAAKRLRVSANGLRDAADVLGIELRESDRDRRQRTIHRDDVELLRRTIEAAKDNRARRAGR